MAKLMTKRIEQSLLQHPLSSQDGKGFNAEIAVMFYNSEGPGTWILTEGEKQENGDWLLFGYCCMVNEKFRDELSKVKKEATEDAVRTAMTLMLTLPLEVLIDHYWQKSYSDRIPKFTAHVIDYYKKWESGELNMDKLQADLWERGRVKIVEE